MPSDHDRTSPAFARAPDGALAEAPRATTRGVLLDALDLRDAVIGEGLMLRRRREFLMLDTVAHGRARHFGLFTAPGAALAALDQIER